MAAGQVGGRDVVRVVVAGDQGTGKSSLIVTAVSHAFPFSAPPLLPPSWLPDDIFPDRVPVTIIDTRSVTVPVIVVGCKLDLRDDLQQAGMEQMMLPIMQQFREIETCIECSAFNNTQVLEAFFYAQKAVLHPTQPLFDQETQNLHPRCLRALRRIFILFDQDWDGALNDAELNAFQVKCFNAPLQPAELVNVRRVVHERMHEGVNEQGLTLSGFLYLRALFIERGRIGTTWAVLRKFGYDNDLRLTNHLLPPTFICAPDQGVELNKKAIEFLRGVFTSYDRDRSLEGGSL